MISLCKAVSFETKPKVVPPGPGHRPFNDMFEGSQQVFGFRVAHIFAVGHQVIQPAVALLDVDPSGSLDQDHDLQGNFEKEQIRLDALRAVQIDRLQIVGTFGTPEGMLVLVLALVLDHGLLDAQVFGIHVGQQRIIATAVQRGGKGRLVKVDLDIEQIAVHGHLLDDLAGRGASSAFVFVSHQGLVVDAVGEKVCGTVFCQDGIAGLWDLFFGFSACVR